MATTNTWDQVVQKITGVANRGAFSRTFTPTTSQQSASGQAGYYSSVNAVCNAVSLSGNAGTGQVLSGYTFYNNSLTRQSGSMSNRGNLNWSGSNTTYSVPAGYYTGGTLDSRSSYNNGYNAGVSAGKTAAWSSKSVRAITCAVSAQLIGTRYPGGHGNGDSQRMCWVQFNTGVSKVLGIRISVEATGEYVAVVWWHAGYPNRVCINRGNRSGSAGAEVAIGSGTNFWVNNSNAKVPVNQYNYDKYGNKTCNITIWYV